MTPSTVPEGVILSVLTCGTIPGAHVVDPDHIKRIKTPENVPLHSDTMYMGVCEFCEKTVFSWEESKTDPNVRKLVPENHLLWFALPETFVIEEIPA